MTPGASHYRKHVTQKENPTGPEVLHFYEQFYLETNFGIFVHQLFIGSIIIFSLEYIQEVGRGIWISLVWAVNTCTYSEVMYRTE